jgi:hypothetical protein
MQAGMLRPNIRTMCLALTISFVGVWLVLGNEILQTANSFVWNKRLTEALNNSRRVRVSELIDFEWTQFHIVGAWDLVSPFRERLRGPGKRGSYFWDQDDRYWTAAYVRPNRDTYFIRVSYADWIPPKNKGWRVNQLTEFVLDNSSACQYTLRRYPKARCLDIVDGE